MTFQAPLTDSVRALETSQPTIFQALPAAHCKTLSETPLW